jgi:hypothetical protein
MSQFTLPAVVLDLILGFTVLEFLVLGLIHQRLRRGLGWVDLSLGLAPGFLLMLTYRVSQPASLSLPVMACLAAAGVVHAADFYRRYRTSPQR